jgi:hypothetical protein
MWRPHLISSERTVQTRSHTVCIVNGVLHGEAGNLDEAFHHLDADPALVHLAVAPQWDPLRADPCFRERLDAIGLGGAADRAQRYPA